MNSNKKNDKKNNKVKKPLEQKAYGSIGHLPQSRKGPGDHSVHEGMARICLEKSRPGDTIIVTGKLDGSNVAVAKINNEIVPLIRAGYPAISSNYLQHKYFHNWAFDNYDRFNNLLEEGEWISGEWLAQAHSTIYDLSKLEPFAPFDIFRDKKRILYDEFLKRTIEFNCVPLLHIGSPISIEKAMKLHECNKFPCDELEGVVYRVEREGHVDFLAKYVVPEKVDGKYFEREVWNWTP